eukprot:TRINITY_DN49393_c0_g1_i1.p1 TRINITY_DN49393_c0_g1~~TRINITY_DN49393_c0_g1_i1.p1  ORF type:complete len:496 (+),score=66.91 TRINITY_DN49393_c0_g1_i1:50-1537(+)
MGGNRCNASCEDDVECSFAAMGCERSVIDAELTRAGGSMPWWDLRDALVAQHRLSVKPATPASRASNKHLDALALAAIPDEYLSLEDELVSLRRATPREAAIVGAVAESAVDFSISAGTTTRNNVLADTTWPGWGVAIDDALTAAGGQLTWRRLRNDVVTRYLNLLSMRCGESRKRDQSVPPNKKLLGAQVLVQIPSEYLSRVDALVRLPNGCDRKRRLVETSAASTAAKDVAVGNVSTSPQIADSVCIFDAVTATEPRPPAKRPRLDARPPLVLVGDMAPPGTAWKYVVRDETQRCYAGHLSGAVTQTRTLFGVVDKGTPWKRTGPRWTAWMVAPPCSCVYGYGGLRVNATPFPEWMQDIMREVMPLCGLSNPSSWPNSCNLNRYDDGWGSVGWHADDEKLFQGKHRDCLILSLSLGQTRSFSVRTWYDGGWEDSFTLADGDLCTMEGMFQKHYQHAILKEYEGGVRPRINLTWRWIVAHESGCAAAAAQNSVT